MFLTKMEKLGHRALPLGKLWISSRRELKNLSE